MRPEIVVERDRTALALEATRRFRTIVDAAVSAFGRATVALAGGSTPSILYENLARDRNGPIDWRRVHVFWGDERCVPPDHADSNYALARRTLLAQVPLPEGNVHRIPAECTPIEDAAQDYEDCLRKFFAVKPDQPSFDLALLGVGEDGHTASLFPGSEVIAERERWVRPVVGPAHLRPILRITLTYPLLNRARHVLFLVAGAGKHPALSALLGPSPPPPDRYPAAGIRARESLAWLVDRDAYTGAEVPSGE